MKTYILSSIFLMFALFSAHNVSAQKTKKGTNNYVVLTNKIQQLQPIILTAEALKAEEGKSFGKFEVIICGKEIGEITDSEKISEFIDKAEKAGVQLIACGFSLNRFKVDKTKVPSKIKVVENGILYNFQLQKKGYKSITL